MPSLRLLSTMLFLLGVLALGRGGAALAAPPNSTDPFLVQGVAVDVTAPTPEQAKDKAILEGQRKAFRQLMERLLPPSELSQVAKVDGTSYVRDFSVDDERALAGRYIANLNVRFHAPSVRKLLQGMGVSFVEPRRRPLVIVPVFKDAQGQTTLWEAENPWRAAWTNASLFQVPTGEPSDVQAITAAQAWGAEPNALRAIGTARGTPEVIVAAAQMSSSGKSVTVTTKAAATALVLPPPQVYTLKDGETVEALLARSARGTSQGIDTVLKQAALAAAPPTGGPTTDMPVLVTLNTLQDWMMVRERLKQATQVRRWDLISLSTTEAAVTLRINSDQEQVRMQLAGVGLPLEWNQSFWVMHLGVPTPSVVPAAVAPLP